MALYLIIKSNLYYWVKEKIRLPEETGAKAQIKPLQKVLKSVQETIFYGHFVLFMKIPHQKDPLKLENLTESN